MKIIGIRREDKNEWEKRVPLVPEDVKNLIERHGIKVIVQPSKEHRIFTDEEYRLVGAEINEDLSSASLILGVKEIPKDWFLPEKAYVFFSHVIKGQKYNMPMLKSLMQKRCSLIDYEKIENEDGKRLIFFGRFAGLAGMVETLHGLGLRLKHQGMDNPFTAIKQPHKYGSLNEIKDAVRLAGEGIARNGLPESLRPFICGFTGYGNVSMGAQEIYDLLPITEIDPETIRGGIENLPPNPNGVYKVVFREENMFAPVDSSRNFELMHYYKNPTEYRSIFDPFVPNLSLMINCIYWTEECPRLVTKEMVNRLYAEDGACRLKVIGDISCDIEGSVEITVKSTDLRNPFYVYDAEKCGPIMGIAGTGPVVMAIENLPCEIPREASTEFSSVLKEFVPKMVMADYLQSFDEIELPLEIKRALIVLVGKFTETYRYISEFLTGTQKE